MKRMIAIFLVIAVLTTMTSCLAIGTGGKKVDDRPTLGQELLDLQKAKEAGAVSQEEYEELKEKLKTKL
jgi:hypothetical protein